MHLDYPSLLVVVPLVEIVATVAHTATDMQLILGMSWKWMRRLEGDHEEVGGADVVSGWEDTR